MPSAHAAAQRRYYLQNKPYYLQRNKAKRRDIAEYIRTFKDGKPCADCRESFPSYVLDFDHRDQTTKTIIVSRIARTQSWRRLHAELAKCDVVCANCHRVRTHAQEVARRDNSETRPVSL